MPTSTLADPSTETWAASQTAKDDNDEDDDEDDPQLPQGSRREEVWVLQTGQHALAGEDLLKGGVTDHLRPLHLEGSQRVE